METGGSQDAGRGAPPIRSARAVNAAVLVLALLGLIYAMYPGRFDGDAVSQYAQGLAFYFDDTHSVLDAALLGVLAHIAKGPGPMFVLQLVLYIGGLLLLTDALIERGRPRVGLAISALALMPLLSFDYFDVQKDALLSALLLVLVGVWVRLPLRHSIIAVIAAPLAAGAFLLALDTRQNAVFALIPIGLLFWPIRRLQIREVLVRLALVVAVTGSAWALNDWIDHGLLRAERSRLQSALMVFDLAGISVRTDQDASKGMLPDFHAAAVRCYAPRQWDSFYLEPGCRLVNTAARLLVLDDKTRSAFTCSWIKAIASHPVAYLSHRTRNFGCLVRLGCYDNAAMNAAWAQRPWDEPDMRVTPAARRLGATAMALWRSPLGSGVLWIATLAAELILATRRLRKEGYEPASYLAAVLASAGLAYILSFAVAGVSDQLRYLHPVMMLAVVAAPLALATLRPSRRLSRHAAGPAARS